MQLIFGELSRSALSTTLDNFDIRVRRYTVGRAVLALAQLSILVLTPYSALMQTVLGQRAAPSCVGVRHVSTYCLGKGLPHWVPTLVMIVVLVGVVVGAAPSVFAVLHAWVSFSILSTIALPDGGDQAAAVFTILLIAVSFGDNRSTAWAHPGAAVSKWRRQVALAGTMMLRVQVAAIYFDSAIAKIFASDWSNGTVEYYVLRDPYFGASGPVATIFDFLTQSSIVTVGMSWGSIVLEISMATFILCGPRARTAALAICILLHGMIILTIGIWSFGLIMIAGVAIASTPTTSRKSVALDSSSLRPARINEPATLSSRIFQRD